jgi:uncharacterized protein
MKPAVWVTALVGAVVIGMAAYMAADQFPVIGAGALLHPARRYFSQRPPPGCQDANLEGAGVRLRGWQCATPGGRRGTFVYLHGIADNRTSAIGVIDRFGRHGFDVVAYDGRAHGESEGEACTYGWFEKQDLHLVLDTVRPGAIVLIGTSLGAAVALQEAAEDQRVSAVVAAEVFSDLRTVAMERAPFFFSSGTIEKAFRVAEREGHFRIDDASPVRAAATVTAPVLLIHGEADVDTSSAHSQRVFDGLKSPKRLILVPGATHNGSLRPEVWDEIDHWLDGILPTALPTRPGAS